ncbi:hypothetical protein D3C72_1235250 [compost metagenome]
MTTVVFGANALQGFEQLVQGVIVAVTPQQCRQPVAGKGKNSLVRQHFAAIGLQVADTPVTTAQLLKALRGRTCSKALHLPAMALEFLQQARFIQGHAGRAAPQQRLARRAYAPAVRIAAHQPAGQGFCSRTAIQLEQARHPRQLRLEPQLPGFVDQTG